MIQRLLEYRRFKEASDTLAKGLETRQKLHPRGSFPELKEEQAAGEEPVLDLGELTSWDLLATFSRLMRETLANQPMHVQGETRPMRYYVTNLAHTIKRAGRLSLTDMITSLDGAITKDSLVGAFCALLELVKIGVVTAAQGELRGEIDVIYVDDITDDFDALLGGTTFDDEEVSSEVMEDESAEDENAPEDLEKAASASEDPAQGV